MRDAATEARARRVSIVKMDRIRIASQVCKSVDHFISDDRCPRGFISNVERGHAVLLIYLIARNHWSSMPNTARYVLRPGRQSNLLMRKLLHNEEYRVILNLLIPSASKYILRHLHRGPVNKTCLDQKLQSHIFQERVSSQCYAEQHEHIRDVSL